MTERKLPLPKRFPGEHVIRCTIWTPSGVRLEYEGPVSATCVESIQAAIVNDATYADGTEIPL